MIPHIENECKSQKEQVTKDMKSLHELIDKKLTELLENIEKIENNEKKNITDHIIQLQKAQQNLIKQIVNFVQDGQDKQPMKRFKAKSAFDEYMKTTNSKLLERKPLAMKKYHTEIRNQINEINNKFENIRLLEVGTYKNEELQQRIDSNGSTTSLDLSNLKLTDQDMEIVADLLRTKEVKYF